MESSLKKKSICINVLFINNYPGGIGGYTYHLVKNMVEQRPDLEFTILTHKNAAHLFSDLPSIKIHQLPLTNIFAKLFYFQLVFPFFVRKYDLLHSTGNMGMLICPIKQVITIHDSYEHVSSERFSIIKRAMMKFVISNSGRAASIIFTDSINSQKDIARFYPHLKQKIKLVYLGNKFLIQREVVDRARQNFIFVGTTEPGKNIKDILLAFSIFNKNHNERLLIIGAKGWKQSAIPKLLNNLGIQDRVDFFGFISDDELKTIYSRSIALIIASNYEGFGLPIIEAMACACPVISARNSSLIEAGGNSAIFFETGDVIDLSKKMESLYLNKELQKQCILLGFEHANNFKWEKTAMETLEGYNSLDKQFI